MYFQMCIPAQEPQNNIPEQNQHIETPTHNILTLISRITYTDKWK